MFAKFDEIPAMILQDIKETKLYGWTDTRTDSVKTEYPPQTKFAGGITTCHVPRVPSLIPGSFSLSDETQRRGPISI